MRWGDPSISEVLFGGYLGLLTLLWIGMIFGVSAWRRRHALPSAPPATLPRLSICVPARNEAHQIGACVAAEQNRLLEEMAEQASGSAA